MPARADGSSQGPAARSASQPLAGPATLLEIRAQHRGLVGLFEALEECVRWVAEHPSAARAEAEALVLIEELQAGLRDHFAFEERGGYFADELAVAPRLAARAEHLLGEHDSFTERLACFSGRARDGWRIPGRWQTLEVELREFIEHVRRHERGENRLIQEALMVDHGGGG